MKSINFAIASFLFTFQFVLSPLGHAAPAGNNLCVSRGKIMIRAACPRGWKRFGDTSRVPSGATLRGFYSTSNYAGPVTVGAPAEPGIVYASVSFNASLGSVPTAHYIAYNESPPTECPGTVNNPEAAAGHLCVYEDGRLNVSQAFVATTAGENTNADFGAVISAISSGGGTAYVRGTWAVTAP